MTARCALYMSTRFRDIAAFVLQYATFSHPTSSLVSNARKHCNGRFSKRTPQGLYEESKLGPIAPDDRTNSRWSLEVSGDLVHHCTAADFQRHLVSFDVL